MNIEEEVRLLSLGIDDDTGPLATIKSRIEHPNYKKLIKLGKPALIILLKELQEGNVDIWRLIAIDEIAGDFFESKPSSTVSYEDRGKIYRISELYIAWGQEQSLI